MQPREVSRVRLDVREIIDKNYLSEVEDAVNVMKAIVESATQANRQTLLIIDFTDVVGISLRTATPLLVAFAGIANVSWDIFFALAGLNDGDSRDALRQVMMDSYLVAVDLTQTPSTLFGRTSMVLTATPIWQWLRNTGGWHSINEIDLAFQAPDVRETYRRPEGYSISQIRTAVGTTLYDEGLIFINRDVSPLICQAVGMEGPILRSVGPPNIS